MTNLTFWSCHRPVVGCHFEHNICNIVCFATINFCFFLLAICFLLQLSLMRFFKIELILWLSVTILVNFKNKKLFVSLYSTIGKGYYFGWGTKWHHRICHRKKQRRSKAVSQNTYFWIKEQRTEEQPLKGVLQNNNNGHQKSWKNTYEEFHCK